MKCDSARILAVFLVLLPSLAMAAEQTMGRLFFTPEQRARMDVARQQERNIRFDVEQQDDAPPPANIILNGVITRSDGKTTLWVNNRIQSEASQGASVGKGGEVRIITPETGRSVPLKVGQSIDMSSGKVEESYRRPPPAPAPAKETSPTATLPGTAKSPAPLSRKDETLDTPADVQGEIPPPR
jgi:hypothetical protein